MNPNKSFKNHALSLCGSFLICLVAGQSAWADDIEIYQAVFNADPVYADPVTNDPNVLFILDNSGSMDDYRLIQENIDPSNAVYDPSIDYGSGSDRDTDIYLYGTDMLYTGVKMDDDQNVCEAARDSFAANPNLPIHQDRFIQWSEFSRNAYGWTVSYLQSNDNKEVFECEDDNGIHGISDNSSQKYPRVCSLGTQTCSSNSGKALYRNSQQYQNGYEWPYDFNIPENIMVDGNYHQFLTQNVNYDSARVQNCSYNDELLLDDDTGLIYRCLQKLEIMKRALKQALVGDTDTPDEVSLSKINLGLMRFNYNNSAYKNNGNYGNDSGGTIIDAVSVSTALTASTSDDAARTNRDDFVEKLDDIQFEGNTPLAESMYEAYRYFAGDSPYSSEASSTRNGQSALDPEATVDGNVGSSSTDETYRSPVTTNQCQGNYVVLLTDGQPTQDTTFDNKIESLPNTPNSCSGNCLDEMATALKKNLGVYTFTIGFDIDIDLLSDTAFNGSPNEDPIEGEGYYKADSLDSLQSVFTRVLGQVQSVEADSFVAPAVTVNAFNRLQNREDIYYAVFAPKAHLRWPGNVKKYKVDSNAQILDSRGINAISEETGFFTDEAESYWSSTADGASVIEGGFTAELLVPRNLLGSLATATTAVTALSAANIDDASDQFLAALDSSDLTAALLGLPAGSTISTANEELAEDIARWTLGQRIPIDAGDPTRPNKYAAESIHSTPLVLSYGSTSSNPQDIVFLVTNQGLLHAITGQGAGESDGASGQIGGSERWAYMPDPDLLENLGGYYNKQIGTNIDHIYGMDGEISALVNRSSANALEKAYLFLTQRRGGNKIFAINITNAYSATNPVTKLWTAVGGQGDLKRLGDTWSKPVVTKFPVCSGTSCEVKDVIVVGGGYDEKYDDASASIASMSDDQAGETMGNAVYILDAETGAVLWSASNKSANIRSNSTTDIVVAEMDHSIPAAPLVLDLDKDGALDVIYVNDIAGQVFRFDFDLNSDSTSLSTSGGRIANLQESGVNRRFYNPLDGVVLPRTSDGANNRIALVTGSGYRAHPVAAEGFANRFYVLYDENLGLPDVNGAGGIDYKYVSSGGSESIITASNLSEITSSTALAAGTTHKYGYYVTLNDTSVEKVINPTLIADFQVIAVSYIPSVDTSNLCASSVGNSLAYRMDLLTGEIETVALEKPGVSAAPVLVDILDIDENGKETLKPIVIIGTEPFKGKETFKLQEKDLGKAKKSAWWEKGRGYEDE